MTEYLPLSFTLEHPSSWTHLSVPQFVYPPIYVPPFVYSPGVPTLVYPPQFTLCAVYVTTTQPLTDHSSP